MGAVHPEERSARRGRTTACSWSISGPDMNRFWLRPRDLLSVECLFVLFIFAGAYKETVEGILGSLDVTLATCGISLVFSVFVLLRDERHLTPDQTTFAATYGLLIAVVAISSMTSTVDDPEVTKKIQKFLVFNSWAVCAPLFVINTPERVDRLLRLVLLITAVAVFHALIDSRKVDEVRFVGALGTDHYHALGHASGLCSLIAIAIVLVDRRQVTRFLFGGIAACAFFVMFLSGTRQSLVSVFPAVVCFLPLLRRQGIRLVPLVRFLSVSALAIGLFLGVRTYLYSENEMEGVWSRMLSLFGSDAQGVLEETDRFILWADGIQVWTANPLAGAGFGCYPFAGSIGNRHPHNYFVELLAELGVVGLIVGTALMVLPAARLIRCCQVGLTFSQATGGAIWLFLFCCAMVSGDITDNRMMFAFTALVLFQDLRIPNKAGVIDRGLATGRPPHMLGVRRSVSTSDCPTVEGQRC